MLERRCIDDVQQGCVLEAPKVKITLYGVSIAKGAWRRTSVNVMISFPPIPELNLTFRTAQPGALCAGIVQSQVSSYSHPLAVPIGLLPLLLIPPAPPGGRRLWSVVNTFIGLRERTSHTATMPSCEATANLEPDGENAVQKDAGSALALCIGCALECESKGGSVS